MYIIIYNTMQYFVIDSEITNKAKNNEGFLISENQSYFLLRYWLFLI